MKNLAKILPLLLAESFTGNNMPAEDLSVRDWKYNGYNPNKSAYGFKGYDADVMNFLNYMGKGNAQAGMSALGFKNYDADFRNFDAISMANTMSPKDLRAWLQGQVASGAMTTSRLRVVYTPGVGSPAPVEIKLFSTIFTTGVFNGDGDLVFTNAGGDTATVSCMTTNGPTAGNLVTIKQLYDMTNTQPFTIGFMRIKVKTVAQFDYAIGITADGQFGGYGGNSIVPDDYVDPDQYQFLRVDVPMNADASNQKGFTWTIDEDQTGAGVNMTLFITTTINPNKQLAGQSQIRVLNNGVDNTFFTPSAPTGQLASIASSDAIKNIMSSGMDPSMGANIIKTQILPSLGLNLGMGSNGSK